MNPDSPRVSKHPRMSLKMVKTLSSTVVNQQEAPQKIPDKPEEEEKKGKEVDPASLGPDGALQYYAKVGDLEGMRKAYQEGGKVNVPDRGAVVQVQKEKEEEEDQPANNPITGDYPMHMAAGGGHKDAVAELLNWEADIEAKNRIGSTPLIRAASHDQIDIVKRLLKEGASIEATNKIGNTALHCAAYTGSLEIAKLLLEAQASAHILQPNKYGATPLMIAAKSSALLAKYLHSFRPGRSGGIFSEEAKETKLEGEKRKSTTEARRLSVKNHREPSSDDLASPSVPEQRTIAAPSLGGVELTILSTQVSEEIGSNDEG